MGGLRDVGGRKVEGLGVRGGMRREGMSDDDALMNDG